MSIEEYVLRANTNFLYLGALFAIILLLMYIAFYKNSPQTKRHK